MGQITRTNFGLVTTRELTNSEVIHLPTTPVEIVPSLGAGKLLLPHLMVLSITPVVEYMNIDGACVLSLSYSAGGEFACVKMDAGAPATLLGSAFANISTRLLNPLDISGEDISGASLVLVADNNGAGIFTGGGSANILKCTVFYSVAEV